MSEHAQEIMQKASALPPKLQEKFLDKLDGATMALEAMAPAGATDQKGDAAGGSSGVEQRGSA